MDAATRSVDEWAAPLPKEHAKARRWRNAQASLRGSYADLLRVDSTVKTHDLLQGNGTITYLNSRNTIQAKYCSPKTVGASWFWEAGQDASGGGVALTRSAAHHLRVLQSRMINAAARV